MHYSQFAPLRASFACAVSLLAIYGSSAAAQDSSVQASAATSNTDNVDAASGSESIANEEAGLGVIIVTARKVEEDLQRASISLTALRADELSRQGINDPMDLGSKLPAVRFQQVNVPSVIIRGVGTYNNDGNVDSAVGYFLDGIYLAHLFAVPPLMFDLNRIEAVRGPQGTLFGRNSNGGGISFITNRPVHDFEAAGAISVGNYDAIGTEAMINLPLAEGLAVRASFASEAHDPYMAGGYMSADNSGARIRLLYEPTPSLEFILTGDYYKTDGNQTQYSYCPPNSTVPTCQAHEWDPYGGLSSIQPENPEDFFTNENWGVYLESNLDLDVGTLTSLTSYREYRAETLITLADLGYSANQIPDTFFSQEIRLSSRADSRVQWVLGAYYSRETLEFLVNYTYFNLPYLQFHVPGSLARSAAVFGQLTVPLTDSVRLIGGLRYTDEIKDSFGTATAFDLGTGVPNTVDTGGAVAKEKRLTYKAGVDVDIGPESLIYASISNGFKSGGVNQVPQSFGLPLTYDPETVTAYQIGSKNRLADDRIQINGEAFYYDYKGYQAYSTFIDPTGSFSGPVFTTVGAEKTTFYGGEVELTAILGPRDRLDLAGTLLWAKFDSFMIGATDLSGNDVAAAPPWTVAAAYQHTFDVRGAGEIAFNVDSMVVGGHYVDNSNAPGSFQDTYTRTNANVTYQGFESDWSVSLFVRNLENKGVLQSYFPAPLGPPGDAATVLAPRVFGVRLRLAT